MGTTSLDDELRLPAHAISVYWDFEHRCASVEFDITIHDDPGTSIGEYLSPFNGEIDGGQIYLGIQTNVFRPGRPDPGYGYGTGIGKGLIFSTWWTFDAADTRVPDDGFIQLGTHEGRFVGVRRPYEWGPGDYRLRLARAEPDSDGDWFDLTIEPTTEQVAADARPAPTGPPTWIGSLRFRRRDPDRPATISSRGSAFLEVYRGASTFRQITPWWCDLQAYGDGTRSRSATSGYPAHPHGQVVPNSDCWHDPQRDRVHLAFGGDRQRFHDAGRLY